MADRAFEQGRMPVVRIDSERNPRLFHATSSRANIAASSHPTDAVGPLTAALLDPILAARRLALAAARQGGTMTLLISNENVQEALDSRKLRGESIIDAIESAYRDLGADR